MLRPISFSIMCMSQGAHPLPTLPDVAASTFVILGMKKIAEGRRRERENDGCYLRVPIFAESGPDLGF